MAVKMKRSAVAGKVPTTAQLELGELAINTRDGKLYFKKDDGSESIVKLEEVDTSQFVSAAAPVISSVDGEIYEGVQTSLTLTVSNMTHIGYVVFSVGGSEIISLQELAFDDSGIVTVPVPAEIYGAYSSGTNVTISVENNNEIASTNSIVKSVVNLSAGGTVTEHNGYRYHAFTSSETFFSNDFSGTIEYLVVAGGGGGGHSRGGGGGAGGLVAGSASIGSNTAHTITVGAGGSGASSGSVKGSNGGNSTFGSFATALGGGGGASDYAEYGRSGGSGGGGSLDSSGGSGTSGQGFGGGAGGRSPALHGGGGGGASEPGQSTSSDISGGAGDNSFSEWAAATGLGDNGYFAGGGGGYCENTSMSRDGGAGGGGNGGRYSNVSAQSGQSNTGGGGGGGWTSIGNGGSGVVILRYAI